MPIQMKGKPLLPEKQKLTYEEFYESTAKNEAFFKNKEV
jgi:hypothetical protein